MWNHSSAVTPRARLPSLNLCRRKRGRPALAAPQDWQERCARAGLTPCPELGVDRSDYVYFAYDCGCIGYKQVRSLRRRGDSALQCLEHGSSRKPLSELLLRVRADLQRACPNLGPVVLEAHLLPGVSHKFDLWLPRWRIAAEVDGRQHFTGEMHGKAAAGQYKADRQLDAACAKRPLRLLRFHFQDDKQWGSLMQRAVQQVQENPHCHFVMYTGSYTFEAARQAPTV